MQNEILSLITLIAWIALMARWGLLLRFLPPSFEQRIRDELRARLKASAPHLRSTFDSVNLDSGSSTSR